MASGRTKVSVRCIIFDLDGVILDSEPSIRQSLDVAFAAIGQTTVTDQEIRLIIGPPLLEGIQLLLEKRGQSAEAATEVLFRYRSHYQKFGVSNSRLFGGVEKVLRILREEGSFLAVATSKPARFTLPILKNTGIASYFSVVGAPADGEEYETKTKTLAKVLEYVPSKSIEQAVMVGDRDVDMKAAVLCGITGVGVLWGHGLESELMDAGAVVVFQKKSDLLKHLLG